MEKTTTTTTIKPEETKNEEEPARDIGYPSTLDTMDWLQDKDGSEKALRNVQWTLHTMSEAAARAGMMDQFFGDDLKWNVGGRRIEARQEFEMSPRHHVPYTRGKTAEVIVHGGLPRELKLALALLANAFDIKPDGDRDAYMVLLRKPWVGAMITDWARPVPAPVKQ